MKPIHTTLLIIAFIFVAVLPVSAADGPDRAAKKYFKKGRQAYEKVDYKTARENLLKAIEPIPHFADAHYMLGQIALAEKKAQQAMAHFSKAAQADPGHVDAQLAIGRIFLAARMPEEALVRAETVLKNDPANPDATLMKASALMAQKRGAEATATSGTAVCRGQRQRDLILLLAGAYLRQGQNTKGESVLKAGIEAHPQDIALHLQLANAHLRSGDLKASQAVMETVMGIDPKNPAHAIALARLYSETGETGKADRILKRTLKDDPSDPSRCIAVANVYLEKKQIDRAQDILNQGIAMGDPGARLRLALGELYLKTSRPQEAVDLLKKGLASTPEPAENERIGIQNALARIYLAAKDPATAKTHAQAVLDYDPVNFQALLTRGMAAKALGKPDAAIPDFKQVLRRKPDYLQGHIQLADTYVRNRQTQQARATLNTALRLAPDNSELLMAMYRVCLMDKDYKQAETHLRTLVEKHPDAVSAQAELGDFYLVLNDTSAARREYSEIVLKSPGSAIGYVKLARLYAGQGQIDSAVAQLQSGLARVKPNQTLAAELTTLFLQTERIDEAKALCDARLVRHPDEAFAHYLKGKVMTKSKKYKAAQKAFEKAAELDPMWPEAGNGLAAVFLLQNKKDKAIKRFETDLSRNPKNPTAYLALGRLYEDRSETAKAIDVYEKAVGQIPGFWSAANRLAFLLADQAVSMEALDRATGLATAAYRMKPGQAAIVDTLGWIYHKKGDTKQALHLYEQLIAAAPDDPVVNYHMGVVLEKSGDIETARQRLKTATKGDAPFFGREHAEAMLKELEARS
jgi:tetratricopeptide (TPR) repeat protein